MTRTTNKILISSGLIPAVILSYIFLKLNGAPNLVTGFIWGLVLAYIGLVVFVVLLPSGTGERSQSSFVMIYMLGAMARLILLAGALCAILFWLHVNSLGLLIGAFIGVVVITFAGLFKLKAVVSSNKQ